MLTFPQIIKKYFGHILADREIAQLWKYSFDIELSMLYNKPCLNTILLDEWLTRRFNLDENKSFLDNLSTLIGKTKAELFRFDCDELLRKYHQEFVSVLGGSQPQTKLTL